MKFYYKEYIKITLINFNFVPLSLALKSIIFQHIYFNYMAAIVLGFQ